MFIVSGATKQSLRISQSRSKSLSETGIPSALALFSLQAKQPKKRVTGLNHDQAVLTVSVKINCVLSVERRKKSPIAAFE